MTPVQEFSAMVQRLEPEIAASGAGYTPALRRLEVAVDAANLTHDRPAITAAIRQLEVAWRTEIAKAQRTRRGESR